MNQQLPKDLSQCCECGGEYPFMELTDGLCTDCRADFDQLDLEDQLEKAMGYEKQ